MSAYPWQFTTLDELVYHLLKRLGWTQTQLSAEIDLHPSAISRVCKQKSGIKAEAIFIEQLRHHLRRRLTAEEHDFLTAYLGWIEQYSDAWTTESWAIYRQQQYAQSTPTTPVAAPLQAPSQHMPPHNLPAALTSLLGRSAEIAELVTLLKHDRSSYPRLVTLVGPGGVGKTQLALECGRTLQEHFPDGVFLVELAPLASADLLVGAVAQAVQLRDRKEESLLTQLKGYLQGRTLLLILDNFEHLLNATPIVHLLLQECPTLTILATSRVRLNLYGEHEFGVEPLAFPPPSELEHTEALQHYAAIQLFCERAAAASRLFTSNNGQMSIIAAICSYLHGLPLAIELAAAQMRRMSPQTLWTRLHSMPAQTSALLQATERNRPDRHRSVHSMIEWSYSLLSAQEQQLFRRLSCFVDGFDLTAATRIGRGQIEAEQSKLQDIEGQLKTLLDHHLVQLIYNEVGVEHYSLLEMMQQFGHAELERQGELNRVQSVHAAYYLEWLHSIRPMAEDARNAQMVNVIRQEYANLRTAFHFYQTTGDSASCIEFCNLLHSFWNITNDRSSLAWTHSTLTLAESEAPSPALAELLTLVGYYEIRFTGRLAGRPFIERAIAVNKATGNRANAKRVGIAYGMLAWIYFHHDGDYKTAEAWLDAAEENDRVAGDEWALAMTLVNHGHMVLRLGQLERAEAYYKHALQLHQKRGDPWAICMTFVNHAQLAILRGELTRAEAYLQEARVYTERTKAADQIANIYYNRAWIALLRGTTQHARQLLITMLSTLESLDGFQPPQYQLEKLNIFMLLAERMGEAAEALVLAGAIEANLQAHGLIQPPQDRRWFMDIVTKSRQRLDQDIAEHAWERGMAMNLGNVLAQAKYIAQLPVKTPPDEGPSSICES